jgi:uncharacterized membrane protein
MTEQQGNGAPSETTKAATADGTVTVEGVIVATEDEGVATVVAAVADDQGNAIVQGAVGDQYGLIAEGGVAISGDDAIFVARFADRNAATSAYQALIGAEAAGRLDLDGVLVANADETGKVNIVKLTDHHTRKGFLAGAVAGVVVGIIFPPSIIGSALALGVGGGAIGKLQNVNQRSKVAQELASVLTPGSSGIIAVGKLAQAEDVKKEIPAAEEVKAAPVSEETAATVKEAAKEAGSVPA